MATIRKSNEKYGKNQTNVIMVFERDLVRKLIIPRDHNEKSDTLLSESRFNEIKNNSQVSLYYFRSSVMSTIYISVISLNGCLIIYHTQTNTIYS